MTENKGTRAKITFALVACALVLLCLAAFEQVRRNEFVNYDDDKNVTNNPHVQMGLNVDSLVWTFTSFHTGNWHPLTWISHIIDCSLFGLKPAGHHLVSLGFHIANVLLLFLILDKMTGALWRSAFVAALFGVHPLAVESVAWIAERKDVLSTFFILLTILAYIHWTRKHGVRRYAIILVLFAAALLSKPMAVTLPFVLILLDYWPLGKFRENGIRRLIIEKLPLFAMSIVSCVVTYIAQGQQRAISGFAVLPLDIRLTNALVSYIKYIGRIFYPSSLAVLYPFDIKGPALWEWLGCLSILITITAIVVLSRKGRGYLTVGWFWFLGILVPVIGLVQVGGQSMADRYTYLPRVGIYIAVVWLAGDLVIRLRLPKAVPALGAIVVLAALVLVTRIQVGYWKDSLTLSQRAVAVTQNNYAMHNNLGVCLAETGQIDEAMSHMRRAIEINPKFVDAYVNLATALQKKGQKAEALAQCEKALALDPNNPAANNNYGILLAQAGKIDEAMEHFKTTLQQQPYYFNALNNLYIVGVRSPDKIGVLLETLLDLQKKAPANAELFYRAGLVYNKQGNFEKSTEQLERALKIATRQGKNELATKIKEQLKLNQQGIK
jgi:tetratricopeptide (TPR) repeat protein